MIKYKKQANKQIIDIQVWNITMKTRNKQNNKIFKDKYTKSEYKTKIGKQTINDLQNQVTFQCKCKCKMKL